MKKILFGSLAVAGLLSFAQAEFDPYGHLGLYGETNTSDNKKDYAGLSASVGFNLYGGGFSFGLGGWAAIPIYENTKKNADNIYKDMFVLSEAYFAYDSKPFGITLGRYDTNKMGYEWFSGHNEGVSLRFGIGNFMNIWALYSYEQAFQFQRVNRETASQINALWNYERYKDKSHLAAAGIDLFFGDVFTISPYAYFLTRQFVAPGVTLDLLLGKKNDLYSQTQFKYTFIDGVSGSLVSSGQLFLIDQEFGYDWFKIGGGYYKTTGGGLGSLTSYGDSSRFYGSMVGVASTVGTGFHNKVGYFTGKQSTWYAFMGARHNVFKFDLLYANGGYKELSALLSFVLFNHLEFGAGYIDLANTQGNKRNYVTGFVKAIW